VDLPSDLVLAAEVQPADQADTATLADSVLAAQINLQGAGSRAEIEEVVADKGYHAAATLELCAALELRTYIPERRSRHRWRWSDEPAEFRHAVYANRRRVRRAKSKRLQRRRSEVCERTFAHICDTGGARRSWLRGLADVSKRYLIAAAAHNLGRLLRLLTGVGKPKALQGAGGLAAALLLLGARLRTAGWYLRALIAHILDSIDSAAPSTALQRGLRPGNGGHITKRAARRPTRDLCWCMGIARPRPQSAIDQSA